MKEAPKCPTEAPPVWVDPPSLEEEERKGSTPRPIHSTIVQKAICLVRGHVVNPGHFIDSHGNDDGLSYCERCGQYDV